MATVKLENISKSFGETEVLFDINLEINDKEFVVFVGPSGCGKTTLLRIISGLEEATVGSVLIDGNDVSNAPPVERGIMFNGRVLHYSHRLMWYRGSVYCRHCGYYSRGLRVGHLAKRCRMKPKASQAPVLKRIKRGVPPTDTGWPLPLEAQSPMDLKPLAEV